jgi:hypothetical protein
VKLVARLHQNLMGRIFTVDFLYEGKSFTAFVKISNTADLFSVHIHLPDTSLHRLIPQGNIFYKNTEGLTSIRHDANAASFELVNQVINAIEQYLQQH